MGDNLSDASDNDEEQGENALPQYILDFQKGMERPRIEDESAIGPAWLVTFTDIMALMLTFFVLLYSMAQPDVERWDEMTGALNRNFNQYYAPEFNAGTQDTINISKVDYRRALDLGYLATIIQQSLQEIEAAQGIVLLPQKDSLIISMPEDLLFESGQAEVVTAGKRVLFTLGGALRRIKNKIEIVGHADPRPISENNLNFKSNWDLSLTRAVNVADVLKDVGYDRAILVRGASSGRYDDLPSDLPEEERLSLSRRVDIVVLKNDGRERMVFGN